LPAAQRDSFYPALAASINANIMQNFSGSSMLSTKSLRLMRKCTEILINDQPRAGSRKTGAHRCRSRVAYTSDV